MNAVKSSAHLPLFSLICAHTYASLSSRFIKRSLLPLWKLNAKLRSSSSPCMVQISAWGASKSLQRWIIILSFTCPLCIGPFRPPSLLFSAFLVVFLQPFPLLPSSLASSATLRFLISGTFLVHHALSLSLARSLSLPRSLSLSLSLSLSPSLSLFLSLSLSLVSAAAPSLSVSFQRCPIHERIVLLNWIFSVDRFTNLLNSGY